MHKTHIKEMKEMIQSSNLNFLIGAGLSTPFLPVLNNIEARLTSEKDEIKRINIYREYFETVMIPNLDIINNHVDMDKSSNYQKTYNNYKKFFEIINYILLNRKNTILSKQANMFTTNIDILMETVLEGNNLEYNDGFSGRMNPTFSLSNFKKSISKRSLHFENISEIPVFNIIKLHGSLTWNKNLDHISFSRLDNIKNANNISTDSDFIEQYEKLAIVNPDQNKFKETVLESIYYELLRMYSSELEKENTILFVMGFSMADQHIQEITIRSANSNPTLKIFVICHSKDKVPEMKNHINSEKLKYSNIEIIEPHTQNEKYDFEAINNIIFKEILSTD